MATKRRNISSSRKHFNKSRKTKSRKRNMKGGGGDYMPKGDEMPKPSVKAMTSMFEPKSEIHLPTQPRTNNYPPNIIRTNKTIIRLPYVKAMATEFEPIQISYPPRTNPPSRTLKRQMMKRQFPSTATSERQALRMTNLSRYGYNSES